MTMTDQIPAEAIEAAAKALSPNPAKWQDFQRAVLAVLTAALPFLRPEPSKNDKAALSRAIRAVTDLWDEPLDKVHDVPPIVNAVLAAGFTRHPAPSREQVARRLSTCKSFEPDVCDGCARRLLEADRVLALFKGGEG